MASTTRGFVEACPYLRTNRLYTATCSVAINPNVIMMLPTENRASAAATQKINNALLHLNQHSMYRESTQD